MNNNQIMGWELSNPDPGTFTLEVVDDFGVCSQCELAGQCDGLPAGSLRRLVPRSGRVISIGEERHSEGVYKYYALIPDNGEVRFILFKDPVRRWSSAAYIAVDEVPAWSLRELRELEAKSPPDRSIAGRK